MVENREKDLGKRASDLGRREKFVGEREQEVEKILQQNPDLTRKKLEEADKLLRTAEQDGFAPEKVVADRMFHIHPDLTQVLLEVWLRERKAHLDLLRNKLPGV